MFQNRTFTNYISLGYFCSIAEDLGHFGLRSSSMPFDWVISELESNLNLISSNFKDLFNINSFSQSKAYLTINRNTIFNFSFFHDFTVHSSLAAQIKQVEAKYQKRINSFYLKISKSTLIIRYLNTELDNREVDFVMQNIKTIISQIKRYNIKNEIIFILNNNHYKFLPNYFFIVEKDNGDKVCRHPLIHNNELKSYF
jgi:hypothetical protein